MEKGLREAVAATARRRQHGVRDAGDTHGEEDRGETQRLEAGHVHCRGCRAMLNHAFTVKIKGTKGRLCWKCAQY